MSRPKIDSEISEKVQKYANQNFNGNFTQAVNHILSEALSCDDYLQCEDCQESSESVCITRDPLNFKNKMALCAECHENRAMRV